MAREAEHFIVCGCQKPTVFFLWLTSILPYSDYCSVVVETERTRHHLKPTQVQDIFIIRFELEKHEADEDDEDSKGEDEEESQRDSKGDDEADEDDEDSKGEDEEESQRDSEGDDEDNEDDEDSKGEDEGESQRDSEGDDEDNEDDEENLEFGKWMVFKHLNLTKPGRKYELPSNKINSKVALQQAALRCDITHP